MVTAVSNKSNYLYGLYGPIYSTYDRHMTWKCTMEVLSDSRVHSTKHPYSIQFSCVLFGFDSMIVFDTFVWNILPHPLDFCYLRHCFSHMIVQISRVSCQKVPYPPCLRMADRPFWQNTLDIWLAQLQWRTLTEHGYNYPVSNHSGRRQKSIQIIGQLRRYHGRFYCTKKIDEPGKRAHEIRWGLLFADFIIMISCLVPFTLVHL